MAISFYPRKNSLSTRKKLLIAAELALGLFLFIIPGGPVRPIVEDGPDPEEVANFHLNGWPEVSSWYVPLDFFMDEQMASGGNTDEISGDTTLPAIFEEKQDEEPNPSDESSDVPNVGVPQNDPMDEAGRDKDDNRDNDDNQAEEPSSSSGTDTPSSSGSSASHTETAANYTVIEDHPLQLPLSNNATEAVLNVTQPQNGSVTLNPNGTLIYTPDPNFFGTDSFVITTGSGGSTTTQNVTVTVVAVNDPPLAYNITVSTMEDVPVIVTLVNSTSDVDGDVSAIVITQPPSNGVLVVNSNMTVTYIPNANFYGTDSFSYSISDSVYNSTGTVNISVAAANDSPMIMDDALDPVTTNQSTPVQINILSSIVDPDGDLLTVANITNPADGQVTVHPNGTVTYTPDQGFAGQDMLEFTVTDPSGGSVAGTVTIIVQPSNSSPPEDSTPGQAEDIPGNSTGNETPTVVNTVPTSDDLSIALDEDGSIEIQLQANDEENDSISYGIVTPPLHGIVTINSTSGVVLYTPYPNYFGPDSFTYLASDGIGNSSVSGVSISVLGVNDAPVAVDYAIYGDEGDSTLLQVITGYTDADGDELMITIATMPQHGTIVVNANGTIAYTPDPDFHGMDSFEYVISDGNGGQATATVTITLSPVNDVPTSSNIAMAILEDQPIDIQLPVTDSDGDSLMIQIASSPEHGSLLLLLIDGKYVLTYTPDQDYYGNDTIRYIVTDGLTYSDVATISIEIISVNDSPTAIDDEAETDQETEIQIDVLANDIDPDSIIFIESVGAEGQGLVTISSAGTHIIYTPDPEFSGEDSFTYTVSDGNNSATANVVVTVNDASSGGEDGNDGGEGEEGNDGGSEGEEGGDDSDDTDSSDDGDDTDGDSGYDTEVDHVRGFVTGGGWIEIAGGSYLSDTNLTGQLHFGFVAKYHKGEMTPKGQTQVQIDAGDINFHSGSLEWLAVDGSNAQFEGTGTIDGEGEYGFLITVIDGQGEDLFRMKIWDESSDSVIFDTMQGAPDDSQPSTVISGGSIQVHKS